jgi:hypothetical protein
VNAASLLVKIGCDVEDFTRGMTKAERAATKGFKEISERAKQMTELFVIEFGAAALEFAHLAAEAQDASARMDRVFGGASQEMKEKLEALTSVIPESVAQLQNLAVQSDNMLQGLGYGAEKAANMSVEMVKLAGDMAAFAHVPVAEALDALDRGLAGKTRGLIQFGIVVSQTAIHQEAMRRGLINNHRTLTELGTAEISHALILKASTRIQGEAARTAGQASNSFKFLKQAVEEMGVSIGNVTIPAVAGLAHALKALADAVEHVSPETKKLFFEIGLGIGAVVAATFAFARLGRELIALRAATVALAEIGGAAGGLRGVLAAIGGMSTLPLLTFAAGFTLLAAAATLAYKATQNVMRELNGGQLDSEKADEKEQAEIDAVRGALIRHKRKLESMRKEPEKKGPLTTDPRRPIDIFTADQSLTNGLFDVFLAKGDKVEEMYKRLAGARATAFAKMNANAGKSGDPEFLLAAAKAFEEARRKIASVDIGRDMAAGTARPGEIHTESLRRESDAALQSHMADTAVQADTAMRLREKTLAATDMFNAVREAGVSMGEQIRQTTHDLDVRAAMLTMKDGFNAAKTAAVQLGERFRQTSHDFATTLESFKSQWANKGNIMASAGAGLKEGAMQVMQMFTPAGLAAMAFGKVMQGLQPVIDALMMPLVEFGKIIGIIAIPLLRPLFTALKMVGIQAALVGEVLYSVAGGIARVIGGLISAIGSFIRKIPFLGGIGKDIQDFGDGITNLGKSFFKTADDLDTARRQLQDLSFEDAMNGVTKAANAAASAMLNVPTGFKSALAQFNAQTAVGTPTLGGPVGASSVASSSTGNLTVTLVLPNGDKLTTVVLKDFKRRAQAQFGDSTRWAEVMA